MPTTCSSSPTRSRTAPAREVTLYPYARIYRYGTPKTEGNYILHEGLIGVLGEQGLQEHHLLRRPEGQPAPRSSRRSRAAGSASPTSTGRRPSSPTSRTTYSANLKLNDKKTATTKESYQADYPAGCDGDRGRRQAAASSSSLFAGAKQVHIVDGYLKTQGIKQFDLMIDWGWFWFFTKPLFYLIEWLYKLFGNFGVAILAVTVLVKLAFFPLANKSYEFDGQDEEAAARDGAHPRPLQGRPGSASSRRLMELYKKEKVNPLAGCLPIFVQIPVFFALYKVLFISIDMRHAPFFGWIKDLSAPDPTSLFNLFGLLPVPPLDQFLLGYTIGAWALVMGLTMWFQMQLNPQQPDPVQQQIFNWMPVMFTFMLGGFSSGLVIYWAWNNLLSIAQQWVIMRKQGVDVPLVGNVKKTLEPVLRLIKGALGPKT